MEEEEIVRVHSEEVRSMRRKHHHWSSGHHCLLYFLMCRINFRNYETRRLEIRMIINLIATTTKNKNKNLINKIPKCGFL
jgi:hypothetical protein